MFGSIGGFEILVLLAIGLLVFGPRRLPEVGRWVARGLGELRKAAADVKSAVEKEADLSDVSRAASDFQQAVNKEARKLFTDLESESSRPPRVSSKNAPGPPGAGTREEQAGRGSPAGDPGKGDSPGTPGQAAAKQAPEGPPPGAHAEAPPSPNKPAGGEAGRTEEGGPEAPEGTRHR